MDYNDIVHRAPTAYRIFLNESLREGFEKNMDPKEVQKKAAEKWRKMSTSCGHTWRNGRIYLSQMKREVSI